VQAICHLAGELHRSRAAHRPDLHGDPLLHRPSRRRHASIAEEVTLEVDRPLVEQRTDDLVRFAQPPDRASPAPFDPELLEHRDVADAQDHLGPTAAELVQRGRQLRNVARVTREDRSDARTEADALGPVRSGREQQPSVLVVDLVGAVARVIAQAVRDLDRREQFARGLLGYQLQTDLHGRRA